MDRLVMSILMIVIHLKKRVKKVTVSLFICLIQDSLFFFGLQILVPDIHVGINLGMAHLIPELYF